MSETGEQKVVVEVKRHATFGTEDESADGRERWSSRMAFYLAAVGSAVGFGNVWRFPALAKDYGGGAFFIPYLMALCFIGLPVLILEISLGQFHQTGNVGVFGSFHAKFRGVGISSVACAYMLVVYYSMLLAWVTRAFFESWSEEAPWTDEGITGEAAVGYFMGVSNDESGATFSSDETAQCRLTNVHLLYHFYRQSSVWTHLEMIFVPLASWARTLVTLPLCGSAFLLASPLASSGLDALPTSAWVFLFCFFSSF
jgi:hypothetical protein